VKKKKKNPTTNKIKNPIINQQILFTKFRKANDKKIECKPDGIEARSVILNFETLERNDFGVSSFSELWIVVSSGFNSS